MESKRGGAVSARLVLPAVVLLLLVAQPAPPVFAYPSSVVFAPNGEVKALGEVGLFGYGSLALAPSAAPGVAWLGAQVGILPAFRYGRSGVSFGGMEVGVDLFNADLLGTPNAYAKVLFNSKLQLVTESRWSPSASLGMMEVAPFRPERSMNFLYGALTKTLNIGGRSYGRLTVGIGWVANTFIGDPFAATAPTFKGSWPFPASARLALLAGYETPAFGPVSFAVDHVGGVSEISSTNVVLNAALGKGLLWSVGGWFGNDPAAFACGLFTIVTISGNLLTLLRRTHRM